ncbi:OmpA family protein [Hwanghaeella grinnelliae]|uniref:OmpA family protein n=1 Tax=Hwanghaeella grinnelliae TaxID=2500179 RepID=A0A3S2Y434_9PROT|nr:OmpA family protein [Hwanghaeella grinnelliae]RVU38000.1 OmpA family protein [Hwanghaeella grinnelliae]
MKSYLKSTTALAFAAALLTGCAVSSLPDIKASTPSGSAFDVALHKEYVKLAEMEAAEYDWADADTFTVRARSVLEGNSPQPEEISARDLPEKSIRVLTASRERLMAALAAGGREASPEHAAGAQGGFDCWMQEQEEDLQPDDIEACKKAFIFHIEKLEAALQPEVAAAAPPKPVAPPPPLPKPVTILFDFDSAELTPSESAKIDQAIAAFDKGQAVVLRLAGHTDTRGDAEYNQKLSEARVDAVFAALAAKGFNLSKIRTTALGEDLPAVPTGDNVKEQNNRRVVISFGR